MKTNKTNLSVVSEVKLSYINRVKANDRIKIGWSKDAYRLFKESWDHGTIDAFETFKALYVNGANQVLGIITISTGGIRYALADPAKVFCTAIKLHASGIILCHNHPSGTLKPSEQDKQLTERMKHAGEVLGITILDHMIITREGYYSLADEGVL
ncbi:MULTISPECIES: JAB domain-containing protein [Aquimarina]|uniref:DNA repair protein n=1 Tax=Aquimarina algiphila TaxID=2047982 RepID=A0A554VCG9_9FLAO|nr:MULTISPECIES: JAB domain-containing protein [Aquimarina]TSE04398.1 DNA repair protein [Aquimarina algiphila]